MVTDMMMSRLATEPALAGLSDRDLLDLLMVMEEVCLPAKKVLTWEETPVREFGLVLEGTIGVYYGADRERSLAAGETFGAEELRGDRCWRRTLVTDAPVRALVADWSRFQPLVSTNPRFASLMGCPEPSIVTAPSRRRFRLIRRPALQPIA